MLNFRYKGSDVIFASFDGTCGYPLLTYSVADNGRFVHSGASSTW